MQMFPNSLKLSSHPGNVIGFSSMETVNAPRHHPGHLCLVETGESGAQQWKNSKPRALSAAGEQEGREARHSSTFKPPPALSYVEGSTVQI